MAVTLTGTPVKNTSYADGNQAVTIPADAEAVIVCSWMWRATHAGDFTALNWDGAGLDFTQIVTNKSTTDPYDVWAYIMTSASGNWPGTGAKTLYWTFSGAPTEGGTVYVFFVKGLNASTPVRATASQKSGASFTSSFAGVTAGDLSFGVVADYLSSTVTANGGGQTLLASALSENLVDWAIGYEQGESAIVLSTTGNPYVGYIAFAIAVVAATSITPTIGSLSASGVASWNDRGIFVPTEVDV